MDSEAAFVRNGTSERAVARKTAGTPQIDRRVARTRAQLQHALIELIPERGFAAITVDDLCRRANVGRSTFYTHYQDKEALRRATIDDHLRRVGRVRAEKAASGGRFAFSLPMFEHARAFGPLHRAMIADRGDTVHDVLRNEVRRLTRLELVGRTPDGISPEVAVEFVTGAFLGLLGWWIETGTQMPTNELDNMFQEMAARGLPQTGSDIGNSRS